MSDILKQIFSKTKRNGDCLEWTGGYCPKKGAKNLYPQVYYSGKTWRVSRLIITLTKGPLDRKIFVCHKCDNTKCINPDHFFLGTALDNTRDMINKGRNFFSNKTHCKNGHEFNDKNTRIRSEGGRACRKCASVRDKRRYALRKKQEGAE